MNKHARFFAFLAAACLLAAMAAGCVTIRTSGRVTVLADRSLAPALDAMAPEIERAEGVSLTLRYGDPDTFAQDIKNGRAADLVVLGGVPTDPQDSYTLCAPGIRLLMDARRVDNYVNVASGTNGEIYSAAKPLESKNYAPAQAVVDFIRSKQGRALLKDNGFTV